MSLGFALLDPAMAPRPGRPATITLHDRRVRGTVHAFTGTTLQLRAESPELLWRLRPDAHVRVLVVVPHGLCETVLTRLVVQDGLLSGQIVGAPTLTQRRSAPRTAVAVDATLIWLDPRSGRALRADGTTQNLSTGGALVRFPTPPAALPDREVAALLGLRLPVPAHPATPTVTVTARLLQAWDGGARVRIVDAPAAAAERLGDFVGARIDR